MRRIVFLFLILFTFTSCVKSIQKERGNALGTTYYITYSYEERIPMDDVFKQINKSMSTYLEDSDISKINQGDTTVITDQNFKKVFYKAKNVWEITGGLFDPTIENLLKAWGINKNKEFQIPSKQEIDSLLQITGMEKVRLKKDGTIEKDSPNIILSFNALAKGYCVDMIAERLTKHKIHNFLVEIGGEMMARGKNTQTGKDWVIGIENPKTSTLDKRTFIRKITLRDRAIATSGGYRKFKIDSKTQKKYIHIINPKTGFPEHSNTTLSVTVIADTCMTADAYATAFMIMPIEQIKSLLRLSLSGLEVFVVFLDKNEMKTYSSEGFDSLVKE